MWVQVCGAEADGWQQSEAWQWWLEHGLDGIAGGLLGGLLAGGVAWWAVRRTIRHEREEAQRARELAVAEQAESELRLAVARLHAECLTLGLLPPVEDSQRHEAMGRLASLAISVEPLAYGRHSHLAELTNDAFRRAYTMMSRNSPITKNELITFGARLAGSMAKWLRTPEKFESDKRSLYPPDWKPGTAEKLERVETPS